MPLDIAVDRLSIMRAVAAGHVDWLVEDERFQVGVDWCRSRFATAEQAAELNTLQGESLIRFGGDGWYGPHPVRLVTPTTAGAQWLAENGEVS